MKISKAVDNSYRFLILFSVFVISIIVGNLYIDGDQRIYTIVYNSIAEYNLIEAFAYYTLSLTSIEVIHFLLIWIFSDYVPKVLFFSFLNTLFAFLIIKFFDSIKVNILVTTTFVLTNFYLYTLYFAAERLKLGFILLTLGLCIQSWKKMRNSIFFLSILAHFQMIIVLAPKLFELTLKSLLRLIKAQKLNLFILFIPVLLVFIFLISDFLLQKLNAYNSQITFSDFIRLIAFFLLTLWYANKLGKTSYAIIAFFPLFIAVYFVGGDRINMIGYLYFLSVGLFYKNGFNIGVLLTTVYFFGKTILFIESILRLGHGFG